MYTPVSALLSQWTYTALLYTGKQTLYSPLTLQVPKLDNPTPSEHMLHALPPFACIVPTCTHQVPLSTRPARMLCSFAGNGGCNPYQFWIRAFTVYIAILVQLLFRCQSKLVDTFKSNQTKNVKCTGTLIEIFFFVFCSFIFKCLAPYTWKHFSVNTHFQKAFACESQETIPWFFSEPSLFEV